MDECDSFPHARCLQAFRSMAAHLHRQTQSRNAREAGWSIQSVDSDHKREQQIRHRPRYLLHSLLLIGPERVVVILHCRRKFLLPQVSQFLLGLVATWLGPVKSYAGLITAESFRGPCEKCYLFVNVRPATNIWCLDWEIFRLHCSSDWRLW